MMPGHAEVKRGGFQKPEKPENLPAAAEPGPASGAIARLLQEISRLHVSLAGRSEIARAILDNYAELVTDVERLMAAQNEEKSSAAGSADQRTKDWRLGGHRHRGTCKHHVSEVMESTDVAMAAFMAQTVPCGARSSPPSTTSKDNLPDTLRVEHAGRTAVIQAYDQLHAAVLALPWKQLDEPTKLASIETSVLLDICAAASKIMDCRLKLEESTLHYHTGIKRVLVHSRRIAAMLSSARIPVQQQDNFATTELWPEIASQVMEGFWLPSVCTKSTVGSAVTDLPTLLNVVTCRQQTQLDDLHYQLREHAFRILAPHLHMEGASCHNFLPLYRVLHWMTTGREAHLLLQHGKSI